jgi:TPP-dependent pyruvate/acetoin dehydrogenase alpha subunit
LRDRDAATEEEIDEIDTLAKDYAATEADLAVKDPMPDPDTVTRGVYAGDDFAEPRLELVRSPFAS